VGGVGFIVGIDRFMSEARALTNYAGNSVATILVGCWTGALDVGRARSVLNGDLPFAETPHEEGETTKPMPEKRPDHAL
jgi:aerobic C4-dicarboxylate transport protein